MTSAIMNFYGARCIFKRNSYPIVFDPLDKTHLCTIKDKNYMDNCEKRRCP